MLTLEMLPVEHGDSLWLEYGDPEAPRRLLIDGGPTGATALRERVRREVAAAPDGRLHFELLVVTHVDDDHIAGVLDLLENPPRGVSFGDIWFNAYKHLLAPDKLGPVQGERLSDLIEKHGLPWNKAFEGLAVVARDDELPPSISLRGGMKLTLLSPTPERLVELRPVWKQKAMEAGLLPGGRPSAPAEDLLGRRDVWPPDVQALASKKPTYDREQANGSSIALLAEHDGKAVLLAGDAFALVLADAIERLIEDRGGERLALDAFKLPHHGSRKNMTNGLLRLLRCPTYLVSTSGKRFAHPDNEALARVIVQGGHEPLLAFNYVSNYNRRWRDEKPHGAPPYFTRFPTRDRTGLSISL